MMLYMIYDICISQRYVYSTHLEINFYDRIQVEDIIAWGLVEEFLSTHSSCVFLYSPFPLVYLKSQIPQPKTWFSNT